MHDMKHLTPHTLASLLTALTASSVAACPTFDGGEQVGALSGSALAEVSGLVASRANTGILWVQNDSGNPARLYAITIAGTLRGTYTLNGATNVDWEDIAIGPGPVTGTDYLYLADTGDNNLARTSVVIYRVAEPVVPTTGPAVTQTLTGVAALPLTYPGSTSRDVETLLCDPINGDLYLLTRDRTDEGITRVFCNPAPHADGVSVVVTQVRTILGIPGFPMKGGDISPDGSIIVLLLHNLATGEPSAPYWTRAEGQTIANALAGAPCDAAHPPLMPQAEALGFDAAGTGFFITSEGVASPIYHLGLQLRPASLGWIAE